MGYCPKEFIDELAAMTSMYELASEYTKLTASGSTRYTGLCPFPGHSEKNGSFTVYPHDNTFYCYGCDKGINVFHFLMEVNGWDFNQAVDYLCERNGVQRPKNHKYDKLFLENKTKELLYHRRLMLNVENSYDYLLSRGLTLETIGQWGLGANNKNRIMFPMYDRNKNVLGFSMRYIIQPEDKNDKYWHPCNHEDKKKTILKEYYNKAKYLYGIHLYDYHYGDYVYFCEGNFDVILASQEGLHNCFATLGATFTSDHLKFLQSTKKRPVFIYDGDSKGLLGMHKACKDCIKVGITPYVVILDDGMDLADLALREKGHLETYIANQLMPYAYYLIEKALSDYQKAFFAFQQPFYTSLSALLLQLDTEAYTYMQTYIYQQTHLLIDVNRLTTQKQGLPNATLLYFDIEEILSTYRKKLYMLQEPYFKIFIDNMRKLEEEDKAYLRVYIHEITGMLLEEAQDEM